MSSFLEENWKGNSTISLQSITRKGTRLIIDYGDEKKYYSIVYNQHGYFALFNLPSMDVVQACYLPG